MQSTNNNVMAATTTTHHLRGPGNETVVLRSKLASISAERNVLQDTLRQIQARVAQNVESSLLQQSQNYEARLTELHSVIAELRKQLDVQRTKVIPEESCEESAGEDETQTDDLEVFAPSDPDPDDMSNDDSEAEEINPEADEGPEQIPPPRMDPLNETTAMKNRSGTGTGTANDKSIQADDFNCPCRAGVVTTGDPGAQTPIKQPDTSQTGAGDTGKENLKRKESEATGTISTDPKSPAMSPIATLCKEVAQIREEHVAIRSNLLRKEGELDKTRSALGKIAQERDFLQRKVAELEFILKESPRHFPQFATITNSGRPQIENSNSPPPQFKMAERVRLRTESSANSSFKTSPTSPESPSSHNINTNNNEVSVSASYGQIQAQAQKPRVRSHHHQQYLISGAHLVSIGANCRSRVAEQLTSPIQGESMSQEMEVALATGSPDAIREKVREYEVETERLASRMEHYRAQNDVLNLNLAEAKGQANHLATLLGKYESNNVALQMTLEYSDHAIDAYDVLVALLESELGQLLANCRAVGIGSCGGGSGTGSSSSGIGTISHPSPPPPSSPSTPSRASDPHEDEHVHRLLTRANENRFVAENAARTLLNRLVDNSTALVNGDSPTSENNNGGASPNFGAILQGNLQLPPCQSSPPAWEDSAYASHTMSSASSLRSQFASGSLSGGSSGHGCSGTNELRIRELIIQLKTDREAVRNTVMDLDSSWSLEPDSPMDEIPRSPHQLLEAHKLDLETAVLMQELMAMREDRAELRAQLFHLEKDKDSLELLIQKYEVQEEAYKARINYFKAELESALQSKDSTDQVNDNEKDANANGNSAHSPTTQTQLSRESVLKSRIQELASSLEKVTQSSNQRENQCTDMINELKRANGILIETLEGLKRKYQARVHKMEEQILAIVERHAIQLKLYKDRVHFLEIEMDGRR